MDRKRGRTRQREWDKESRQADRVRKRKVEKVEREVVEERSKE